MKKIFLLLLVISCSGYALAWDAPCSFVQGYATQAPSWHTSTGRAEIEKNNEKINIKLFSDDMPGQLTHTVSARVKGNRINGIFINMFSDEGEVDLEGSYQKLKRPDNYGMNFTESLVLQNPYVFVAVTCYKFTKNLEK